MTSDFLNQHGDYHTLKAFQKAECIYDLTYYFAHKFLTTGDRTIDQMIQAARSGKQNLAEGYVDGVTSTEMMIKLINVNRACLQELLLDYEDYLRVRNLQQWSFDDPRCRQTRAFCRTHLDSAVYREQIRLRSDETIAITLIHQEDVLSGGRPSQGLHRVDQAALPAKRRHQRTDVPGKDAISRIWGPILRKLPAAPQTPSLK